MSQNGFIFPNFRGEHKTCLSCHLLDFWLYSTLPVGTPKKKQTSNRSPFFSGKTRVMWCHLKKHIAHNYWRSSCKKGGRNSIERTQHQQQTTTFDLWYHQATGASKTEVEYHMLHTFPPPNSEPRISKVFSTTSSFSLSSWILNPNGEGFFPIGVVDCDTLGGQFWSN